MPKGPRGEKRPADAIGLAVLIGKIATGEVVEGEVEQMMPRSAGSAGGEERARKLTAAERKVIAKKGAQTRWQKNRAVQD